MPQKSTKAFHYVNWPIQKVLAFTTTRQHPTNTPCSSTPYDGFNLGEHVGELSIHIQANRRLLDDYLPENSQIQWLNQVHGNAVVVVEDVTAQPLTADAAITRKKNTCLAVMTADCLPILIASESGHEVAAIHGGWRPLSKNIIASTLAKMQTPTNKLYAWLGPCIGKTAFEVGEEVQHAFISQSAEFSTAFTEKAKNKYLADLHLIATVQLKNLGVLNISELADCTYLDKQQYYSYRRENITGRLASLITCL